MKMTETDIQCDNAAPVLLFQTMSGAVTDILTFWDIEHTPNDDQMIYNALLSPIRAILIRHEYNRDHIAGIKSVAIQTRLAAKYNLSYETVYSITHNRR